MTYRTRIRYTAEQKAEMWDRWQRGFRMFWLGSEPKTVILPSNIGELVGL